MPAPRKKSASKSAPSQEDKIAKQIIDAIESGALDGYLSPFDDAVTDRMNTLLAEEQKTARKTAAPRAASASGGKTVAPPPRKPAASKATAKVKPTKDGLYLISSAFKKLSGAEVSFLRYKDGDEAKSVVVMVTDMAGNPKGKRVVVPTNVLEAKPAVKSASGRKIVRKK
jgi:hypothetical protein